MTVQVEINAGAGASTYKVVVTLKDMETLRAAMQRPSVLNWLGEDLVTALTTAAGPGGVRSIARYNGTGNDALLSDGPRGEPAVQGFYPNGNPYTVIHYLHGNIVNAGVSRDEAGRIEYHPNGVLASNAYYSEGKMNDTPDGRPAYQQYDEEGKLRRTTRYQKGVKNDGREFEPAVEVFDARGNLTDAHRYNDDSLVKTLKNDDLDTYLKHKAALDFVRAAKPGFKVKVTAAPDTPASSPLPPQRF